MTVSLDSRSNDNQIKDLIFEIKGPNFASVRKREIPEIAKNYLLKSFQIIWEAKAKCFR